MTSERARGADPVSRARGASRTAALRRARRAKGEGGFTLIELLIVATISPIIIAALAMGLYALFTLQSGVANRLSDTADAQTVQASFRVDVQSAQQITTQSASTPQCGTGTQLLGLEWDYNATTHVYETVVSYVSEAVTSGSSTTYSLVRQFCINGSLTPTTTTTISSDVQGTLAAPVPTCIASVQDCTAQVGGAWTSAKDVTSLTFPVTEPKSNYSYTLVAGPATSASSSDAGGPISVTTSEGCGYAAPGSGTYASSLCLVDFSGLTGNNYIAATQGCLETSVPLQGGSTLYFCIEIRGAPIVPAALPTWTDGFLGNQINNTPFYTDVPGDPALYQNCEGGSSTCTVNGVSEPNTWGGVTTITFSGISVVGSNGLPDTGWEFVSADAESTDSGEYITWSANTSLYLIPNGESVDTPTAPIGNACGGGVTPASFLTGSPVTPGNTVTCTGYSNGTKTGTMMIEAQTPSTMTVTMQGTGLEGVAFGLLF